MDVSEFIFLLKLFKSFSNVIHSGGGCYKRNMKYWVAFYAGSERSKKVELKKIYIFFLAPLASFFVELFVWSCDIANQRTVLKSVRTVNIVKCGKYSPLKFANFVYFCITREKVLPHFHIVVTLFRL